MNKEMIEKIYKSATEIEKKTGIPAMFIVAQAVLEQGWDITPIPNSNNIYGIKYHIPEWGYVEAKTIEYIDGKPEEVIRKFQKYPTLEDCLSDHTKLLLSDIKGSNAEFTYRECLEHYKKNKDYSTYVECVAKSYATDPLYAKKILDITEVLYEMGLNIDDEVEEAKKLMEKMGIFKPYGDKSAYWKTKPTREELAVILTRFLDSMTITVIGNGKNKNYTINGR